MPVNIASPRPSTTGETAAPLRIRRWKPRTRRLEPWTCQCLLESGLASLAELSFRNASALIFRVVRGDANLSHTASQPCVAVILLARFATSASKLHVLRRRRAALRRIRSLVRAPDLAAAAGLAEPP